MGSRKIKKIPGVDFFLKARLDYHAHVSTKTSQIQFHSTRINGENNQYPLSYLACIFVLQKGIL